MDLKQCKTSIVKIVPDPIKDESINVGVILHCPKMNYIDCMISREKLKHIKFLYPDVNSKYLENILSDIEIKYSFNNVGIINLEYSDISILNKKMASHTNQLRFSEPRGVLAENLDEELYNLFSQYVGAEINRKRKTTVSDFMIKSSLKREFKKLDLLDKVIYTDATIIGKYDEQIKFDFRYLNGKSNYIHSLSFDGDSKTIDIAKVWSKNYNDIQQIFSDKVTINTVFCPPSDDLRRDEFSKALRVLKENNPVLVDYTNERELFGFVDRVKYEAHN